MAIKKKFLKSKPICKCTFVLPKDAAPEATAVTLVGDFNGWDESATALKKLKSGDFKLEIDLETGKKYQFKYLVDGTTWLNDSEADEYVTAEGYSTENSVVSV